MQTLLTTNDVIDALGTNAEVARLFGVKYNNVTNWRTFGYFPPDTYVMIQKVLRQRDLSAPNHLWKMRSRKHPRKSPVRKARAG